MVTGKGGWEDTQSGLKNYHNNLISIGLDETCWEREGLSGLSKGWAIETHGWRQALAKEYNQLALSPGMEEDEVIEIRQLSWTDSLQKHLKLQGKTDADILTGRKKQTWKLDIAQKVRSETGASIKWLATHLHLGKESSTRNYLMCHGKLKN